MIELKDINVEFKIKGKKSASGERCESKNKQR